MKKMVTRTELQSSDSEAEETYNPEDDTCMYDQTIGKCGTALPSKVTRYRLPQTLISNVLQCKAISEVRYI